MPFNLHKDERDSVKSGRIMKRTKKRHSGDSEKKSAKSEESNDQLNSAVPFPENDSSSGQGPDQAEGSLLEAGTDGSSGDVKSSQTLSFNLALNLILNQKKKELLECPEVMQLLQNVSRNH